MKQTTSYNLWPRINLLINESIQTARSAVLQKHDIRVGESISRGFGDFFGCWTFSKKNRCFNTQEFSRFLSTSVVKASSHALWCVLSNKVIWVLGHCWVTPHTSKPLNWLMLLYYFLMNSLVALLEALHVRIFSLDSWISVETPCFLKAFCSPPLRSRQVTQNMSINALLCNGFGSNSPFSDSANEILGRIRCVEEVGNHHGQEVGQKCGFNSTKNKWTFAQDRHCARDSGGGAKKWRGNREA